MKMNVSGSKVSKFFSPKQENISEDQNAEDTDKEIEKGKGWLDEWKDEISGHVGNTSHSHSINVGGGTFTPNTGTQIPSYTPGVTTPVQHPYTPQVSYPAGGSYQVGGSGISTGININLSEEQLDLISERLIEKLRPLLREVYNEGFQDGLDA